MGGRMLSARMGNEPTAWARDRLTGNGDAVFDTNFRWQVPENFVLCKLLHVVGSRLTTENHAAGPDLNRQVANLSIGALEDRLLQIVRERKSGRNHDDFTHPNIRAREDTPRT